MKTGFILIGADTPEILSTNFTNVNKSLDENVPAFYPVSDGGYCAVGVNSDNIIYTERMDTAEGESVLL